MGYPLLDINRYADGEWSIIQWLKRPTVPAITEWQNVLSGMRNVDITRGFVQKFLNQIDMNRREFWDREEANSRACEDEWEKTEQHAEELATKATEAVMGNDDLLRRIKKNGLGEIDPLKIARNVPYYQW
jgi:hypothetical protein